MFGAGSLGVMKATLKSKVDLNVGIRMVEHKFFSYVKWLGVKPFNPGVEVLLKAGQALLRIAELQIEVW